MSRVKVAGLALSLLAVLPLSASAATPSATCRSTDKPETGMSGETTAAERNSGAAMQGFNCNMDLVGQYQGEGASWQLTAWKNCAYFDQRNPAEGTVFNGPAEAHPGTVVVDVSDPTHPNATTWLATPAMIDPWESVKVNPARQLLGGGQRPLGGSASQPGDGFDVYDISSDCKNPTLKSASHLPGSLGHTGQWAPDGKTYYITPLMNTPSIIAVGVDDPTAPAVLPNGIKTFSAAELSLPRLHDFEFSKDGKTAYITMFGNGATAAGNGFAILDVSDFQNRAGADAGYRVVSQITWDDGSVGAQNALPVLIGGHPYVIMADEGGGGAAGCASGKSANGFPRLIDIADPAHPAVTAKIQLGVADPANCAAISTAPITGTRSTLADGGVVDTIGPGFFAHSCHYCNVDDVDDARILACNCFAAGLRIFDIHDPANIKEMAYFKPPAKGTAVLPGSQNANRQTIPGFVRYYDWATSKPSFPKDRGLDAGQGDIWTTAQDNGFMVVRLFSQVTVSPTTASVETGKTQNFTGTVDGAAKTAGVTWAVQETSGASVTPAGVFTATAAGTYHVIATSIVDRTKSAAATVTATAPASSDNGGCSAVPGSFAGLLPLGALLSWLFIRRRKSP